MKNNIQILDCTLRDGGYLNNWNFSRDNIEKIINTLILSKIDFIEIGFIKEKKDSISNTIFSSFNEIKETIKNIDKKENLCAMIPFGYFNQENIPKAQDSPVKTIRFIYKKQDKTEALKYAKVLKEKGYRLFINPTYVHQYNYDEMVETIKEINKINPFCFSIVDSIGIIGSERLSEMFYTIDELLNREIILGLHSHGDNESAFENAQGLILLPKSRNLIIDSTTHGMGRNRGNLKTETMAEFLNKKHKKKYLLEDILKLSNETILPILEELKI